MNLNLVNEITKSQMRNDLPEIKAGMTIRVDVKIKEGNKERIQAFERGELTGTSQIPYSSLWVGNDGDGGSVSKISFIITGWAVSELV